MQFVKGLPVFCAIVIVHCRVTDGPCAQPDESGQHNNLCHFKRSIQTNTRQLKYSEQAIYDKPTSSRQAMYM